MDTEDFLLEYINIQRKNFLERRRNKMKWLWMCAAQCVLCYPLNFWMMNENSGWYNDPTKTWRDGVEKPMDQKAKYAQTRRAWCLVFSPVFAPIAGFHTVAEYTIPEEYQPTQNIGKSV